MSPEDHIRAVFFDAGETLLGPHPSFSEIFSEVLADSGVEVAPQAVAEAFERVAPTFLEVLDRVGGGTWSTSFEVSRRFWGAVYAAAFEELDIDDAVGGLADALYDRFTRFDSYRLFDDAVPAIEELKGAGIAVGLISNFEAWLEAMLDHWEIGDLFDVKVISGLEGIEKPDPKIFQMALERAGVPAERAVYVGDHPDVDVRASEEAGMTGVLIDRRGRHPDHGPRRIESLSELGEVLRR